MRAFHGRPRRVAGGRGRRGAGRRGRGPRRGGRRGPRPGRGRRDGRGPARHRDLRGRRLLRPRALRRRWVGRAL
ncbi:MAG: hypothetical protein EVA89_11455 [Sandaracinaceae bacterium]|nr:MAG: hypothetical protein EVA89_11455 [Sandaracinaceae bacterium]